MVAHNCHGKNKNITAKPKTSLQNQNTSRQNQILHSKNKIALVLPWVFGFTVKYLVFAVRYLVLPWGLWFCREVFGFTVRYFVFAVKFLVLPWGFRFCREVFGFAVRFLVLPWQLWASVGYGLEPLRHALTPALKDAGLVAWTISWGRLFHIGIGLVRGKKENLKISVRAGRWLNFISCDGWNYARDWPGSGWARPCIACVLVPFRKRPMSLLIAPRNQIQSAPVQFWTKILNKYHQETTLSFCSHALKLEKVGPPLQVQSMSILADRNFNYKLLFLGMKDSVATSTEARDREARSL